MSGKATLIQKEGKDHPVVSKKIASLMVEEGAAIKTNHFYNFFKMRFTNDELVSYVLERDLHQCRLCGKETDGIVWLKKVEEEGLQTPVNLISSCSECETRITSFDVAQLRHENSLHEKKRNELSLKEVQSLTPLKGGTSCVVLYEEDEKESEFLEKSKKTENKIEVYYEFKCESDEEENYYQLKKNLLKRTSFEYHEYQYTKKRKTKIKKVKIKEHAFERWNTRVGPIQRRFSDLEAAMQLLFLEPDRMLFLSEEYGVIDNEIIFTYDVYGEVLFITTFYGRVSLHPSLGDIEYIKRWQNRSNERLNLEIDEEILNRQKMPPQGSHVLYFSGKNHEYKLEEYETEKGRILFLFILNPNPNEPKMKEVRKDNLKGIGKSVKRGIRYMENNSNE